MVSKTIRFTLAAIGLVAAMAPAHASERDLVLGIIGAIASGIQQQAAREQRQPSPGFVSRPHEDYERLLLRQEIQRRLGLLGFNPGPADGVFGPRTRQAIAEFQTSIGRNPSGKISEEEIRVLYAMTSNPAAVSVAPPIQLQPSGAISPAQSEVFVAPRRDESVLAQPLEAQPPTEGSILTIRPSIPLQ
jgi:hypothetical protein